MLHKYMSDLASVSTTSYELDMATSFIYSFHLLSAEDVEGTVWEELHKELPLSPLCLAKRVHELLLTRELPTFAEVLSMPK